MSVAKIEPASGSVAMTPMEMLDRAVSNGASVETLSKLMDLQERWQAAQSRKAYIANMASARAEFQPILKKHDGYNSRYKYENLDDVIEAVGPALAKHGFSYDWITEDLPDGNIRVTCVITHEEGHQRQNSMSGDPRTVADAKANMNSVQRAGAVVSYLQRYTFKAALGVAATKDTDARAHDAPEFDTSDWVAQLADAEGDKARLAEFQKKLKGARDTMPDAAVKQLAGLWSAAMSRAVKNG